jgi:biopolymer transport protein ExbD
MASMTDIIFLLLIFFMITSTMVSPNAIKVLLPQGRQQTSAKPLTRVIIDKNLNFYTAFGNEDEMPIDLEELPAFLQRCAEKEPDMYVALYADEAVPYREIVRVLNIASCNYNDMPVHSAIITPCFNSVTFSAPTYFSAMANENAIAAPGPLPVIKLPSFSTKAAVYSAPSRYFSNPG